MPSSSSNPTNFIVKANAKINLALRITGKRTDGYHDLSTIFQEIDFYDRLFFQPAEKFSLTTNNAHLPTDAGNLCTRAYQLLAKRYPRKLAFSIHLEKNIPLGAGLGGGSADAAAVLKFLNRAWDLALELNQLEQLAADLGADVPFFIRGGTQGASGIGERLTPLKLPHDFYILLAIPNIAVSTAWAYQQFRPGDFRPPLDFQQLFDQYIIHWEQFENQFESKVFPSFPKIQEIKESLLTSKALYVGLSGSGATIFGIYRDEEAARHAARLLRDVRTVVTRPIGTERPGDVEQT
jgi:4-diphosphocytidyl-2-C-methyl-D-erythritol kinase